VSPDATPTVAPESTPSAPPMASSQTGPCSGIDVPPGANLAAAVAAAPAGATLCLSAGTYNTDTTVTLKSNMKLIGAGREATFIKTSSAPTVLNAKSATGVLFQGFDVSGAVGSAACRPQCGRGIAPGLNNVINEVRIHHNANNGVGGQNGGLLVTNSEIDHNGSSAFAGCCAGGIKAGHAYTIRNSYVHDNIGIGIWCDVGCGGGSFNVIGNTVSGNTRGGIRYEISAVPALISGNTVTNNNLINQGGHGGIEINSSKNAVVENNVLGGNGRAGIVANGRRAPGLGNVTIRNNSLNGDPVGGCGGTIACLTNR
jgi:hypothetical protein